LIKYIITITIASHNYPSLNFFRMIIFKLLVALKKKSSSIFFENNNEYTEALVEVAKPFLDILSNQLVDNIMMAAATVNIK
jgi:hypothetical protein